MFIFDCLCICPEQFDLIDLFYLFVMLNGASTAWSLFYAEDQMILKLQ
uniref:Uncharacterized protein n=1 Tax=Anguilla anguilla TaxID=7936 RepID=A0A0E9QXW1_ANGAN